jgi:hypothetical protein
MAEGDRKPDGRAWDRLSESERARRLDVLTRANEERIARARARKAGSAGEPPEIDPARIRGGNGAERNDDDGAAGGSGSGGGGSGGGGGGGFFRQLFVSDSAGKDKPKRESTKKAPLDLRPGDELLHSIFVFVAIQGLPWLNIGPCGDHWEITPAEAKKLNDAWGKASRHFAPKVSEKVADCVNFATVAGGIVAPRTIQTIYNNRQRNAARPATATSPPAGQPAARPPVMAPPPPAAPSPAQLREPVALVREAQTPGQADPLAMLGSHQTVGSA